MLKITQEGKLLSIYIKDVDIFDEGSFHFNEECFLTIRTVAHLLTKHASFTIQNK